MEKLKEMWCLTFHNGRVERDNQGRINWHCSDCGRWSPNPVSLADERRMTNRDLHKHLSK